MSSFITIYPSDLEYAVSKGTISEKQSAQLWPELQSRADKRFTTTLETLGYGSGALLIIGSLTWFTSLAYENPHSLALFWMAILYVFGFGSTGLYFWNKPPTDYSKIVGGLFVTIATSVSPVAVYALDRYYDWNNYFYRGSLEYATLAGLGLLAIAVVNFSPILIPTLFGFWGFTVFTLVPFFYPQDNFYGAINLTEVLGLINIAIAFATRNYSKSSYYSFFLYFFGLLEFCGGLNQDFTSSYYGNSEEFKIVYFIVNLAIFASALPLNQAIFLLFGGYGVCNFIFNILYTYGNQTIDCSVSILFGSIICFSAYVVDRRNENSDYPWWAYLFGSAVIESAATWLFQITYHNDWSYSLLYFIFNIGLTLLYIPTKRWQFVLAGTNGVLWYVNWLLWTYASSYALPLMITLVGLILIGFAVWLSSSKLTAKARSVLRRGATAPDQEQLL